MWLTWKAKCKSRYSFSIISVKDPHYDSQMSNLFQQGLGLEDGAAQR